MPRGNDLVLIGTGSLARSICYALADTPRGGQVTILGRDAGAVREIAIVASARAQAIGNPWIFEGITTDVANGPMLAERLAAAQPRIILQAASLQSFWETETGTSAWAATMREGGYGVTIALQAALIDGTALATDEATPDAILLNACYPDAVNPLLAMRTRRKISGIGNVAILEAIVRNRSPDAQLRILAHHYHLSAHARGELGQAPRIWFDDDEIQEPLVAISDLAAIRGAEINQITGASVAGLLNGILGGASIRCHLCGPLGLPGGYPVRMLGGQVELDLPPAISMDAAVQFNTDAARAEGVVVAEGRVTFTGPARNALARVSPALSNGFPVNELDAATVEFIRLRERLQCK